MIMNRRVYDGSMEIILGKVEINECARIIYEKYISTYQHWKNAEKINEASIASILAHILHSGWM